MAAVEVEIRRTLDWLKHDQVKFWQQEVRRREDAVGEARQDLSRCLISTTAGGTQASCTDQKVALEKAKKRLDQAREKVEVVRRWGQIIEQEVGDYRGPAQQLTTMIDGELPRAMALLARKIQALEEYANLMSEGAAAGPIPKRPRPKRRRRTWLANRPNRSRRPSRSWAANHRRERSKSIWSLAPR